MVYDKGRKSESLTKLSPLERIITQQWKVDFVSLGSTNIRMLPLFDNFINMQALAHERLFIPTQREGSTVTVQVVGDIVRKPADGSGS